MSKQRVLVTGSNGFIGEEPGELAPRRESSVDLTTLGREDSVDRLRNEIKSANVIYHLAGANRPSDPGDFFRTNSEMTELICSYLLECSDRKEIVYSSSTQAELDNPYGTSKRLAEEHLERLSEKENLFPRIYRLPNVFGKLSRPNYNSVVATFCSQIANGQPIQISDPSRELKLVYIDDVVAAFLRHLKHDDDKKLNWNVDTVHSCTLQGLADRILNVAAIRNTLLIPDLSDSLNRALYTTYQSFVPLNELTSSASVKTDPRGWLFELAKSNSFGQVFVSQTLPGVTRGNHYHESKIEKFCLVHGKAAIRLRKIDSQAIEEIFVDDQNIQIVDIPPGYTHSIENVGDIPMIVLFWANEVFDPSRPDTFMDPVK